MNLAKRYSRAVLSGNLKSDALHHDADVLAAIALSSPSDSYGGLLLRVKYANDAAVYQRLLAHWTWIVSTRAIRRGWPDGRTPGKSAVNIAKVASLSLNRFINSACPVCTGRRHQQILGTPSLSDKVCVLCDGTGEAPLRCHPAIRQYVLDMIEELAEDARRCVIRAKKKLGRDAPD